MCEECGCGDPELVAVEMHESLLSGNAKNARHNREHFAKAGVLAVNLMGSPGSGKTALLEATAKAHRSLQLAAMSGDLATDNDARRLEAAGIPARSITTGSACHLDAEMVHRALHHLPISGLGALVVENVGNLVCPAIYDLGQHVNVVALSVTEGEDKPLKYPVMFRKADLVVLTKVDLLPHLEFDLDAFTDAVERTMPAPRIIPVSARTGQGIDRWIAWLEEQRARFVKAPATDAKGASAHEHHHHHAVKA
jgi:hydrogenase nickel incorporation protein HypB